ncbi:type II toxin-antitoxin system Phd/YefM family antitoxin [bacterium AH-315-K03]|nr:type II toxin-antitoxin system Phd/YefM family antitoxin [bacterium AH-315-K03]
MRQWQLQDAKAKFSEVVKLANQEGPQEITMRGQPTAILLSLEDFEKIKGEKPSLVSFLRSSPLVGVDLDLTRDASPAREIEL